MSQRIQKVVTSVKPPPITRSFDHLPPAENATANERAAIRRGRAEYARGATVRLEDLQHELHLCTRIDHAG